MKKYIIANFKTNKLNKEITEYFSLLNNFLKEHRDIKDYLEVIILLNHLHLLHGKSLAEEFEVGSQSADLNDHGSFTSSVSIKEISEEEVKHIILGHSEELKYFNQTHKSINEKIKVSLANNLKLIVCFGEDVLYEDFNETLTVLKDQVQTLFKGLSKEEISEIILAYEPRWAIGLGQALDHKNSNYLISAVKEYIKKEYDADSKILYGGSVKVDTLEGFILEDSIDGVLIGKECLSIDKFIEVLKVAKNSMVEFLSKK